MPPRAAPPTALPTTVILSRCLCQNDLCRRLWADASGTVERTRVNTSRRTAINLVLLLFAIKAFMRKSPSQNCSLTFTRASSMPSFLGLPYLTNTGIPYSYEAFSRTRVLHVSVFGH